jgi:hypothetical protein
MTTIAPNATNLADRLPESVYLQIVDTLRELLPDPTSNDPEHRAQQLEAAIAEVGSYSPVNAAEANLAARYIAFSAHADDCLRLACLKASKGDLDWVAKCRAQANATARQASGQLNLLLRMQKERRKLEKDGHALNRAAWAEHCAIGMMTDALAGRPTPENNSPSPCGRIEPRSGSMGAGDLQPATQCDQTPPPAPAPTAEPPTPAPQPEPPPLSEAVSYAVLYPDRAALIRRLGYVPHDVDFDPPDDDLVQALLAAQDPFLTKLDERFAQWEPPLRAGDPTTKWTNGGRSPQTPQPR